MNTSYSEHFSNSPVGVHYREVLLYDTAAKFSLYCRARYSIEKAKMFYRESLKIFT